jgi:hypothetical protein
MNYYTISVPFITSFGAYLGWITYKNKSLQESIALHTWYDLIILSIGYLGEKLTQNDAMIGKSNFTFSFSF